MPTASRPRSNGERRTEFYRELLTAAPEDAEGVLWRWWCEAMLDTAPVGDRFTHAGNKSGARLLSGFAYPWRALRWAGTTLETLVYAAASDRPRQRREPRSRPG
ncbi:hypothetical protein ACPEIC_45525 [Stenotrophomonas sp. NPDC087984]